VSIHYKAEFSATKILLPIDFSPSSESALEAATGLAQQFHAAVHLVHIIPETPDFNGSDFFPITAVLQESKETIEEELIARKEQLMIKGVSASFSIETGNDIVESLIHVIKRENADMVVISTHGMSGWHPLIFGSIAERLIKQVDCTLLLLQSARHRIAADGPDNDLWEESFFPPILQSGYLESTHPEPETLSRGRLEHVADDLAEQSRRTEQKYDQAHSIFTK
jgi:nucleotide-binding universal stress UspA family protein